MSNPKECLLHFIMVLPASPTSKLLTGKLFYRDLDGQVVEYLVTSSYAGAQVFGTYSQPHHPLPPIEYTVDTTPVDLRAVRGVEGPFFRIRPFACPKPYEKRGDFGIHFDANAPGSNGCIVFRTRAQWMKFQQEMRAMATLGISRIKLIVEYKAK